MAKLSPFTADRDRFYRKARRYREEAEKQDLERPSSSPGPPPDSRPPPTQIWFSIDGEISPVRGADPLAARVASLGACSDALIGSSERDRPERAIGRQAMNQPTAPVWAPQHLRLGIRAAGVALWSWNVDTDCLTMDAVGYALWNVPENVEVAFEDLSRHIHPADRDRVRAAFNATRAIVGPYEIDFRILVEDEVRWISARGRGDDEGIVGSVMYGVFLDVTGRKQAEEAHELLAGEMSHRVKNLIAIAGALTSMSSRAPGTKEEMASELTNRLAALGRAHDLVRPVPGQTENAALLADLMSILLTPYDDLGAFSGRIRVAAPRMGIGEGAATDLALVIHELATNSLKYGALSCASGLLDLTCTVIEDEVAMVWTERGGPAVTPPANASGFGSRLLDRIVTRKLRGSIDYQWNPEGLIATVRVKAERLLA